MINAMKKNKAEYYVCIVVRENLFDQTRFIQRPGIIEGVIRVAVGESALQAV